METKVAAVDPKRPDEDIIKEAGQILREGGLVAFPTETVYGLGGNALDPEASQKIYAAKGRPSDNPLIVHIAETGALKKIAKNIPEKAMVLADACWPGPLTMIFEKTDAVPYETTGGLDTVAVRMPDHPVARALIEAAGGYIAAPSANTSGRPSPTQAAHVKEDLDGRIPLILDAGEVRIGLESTIVDFTEEPPVILRPGYINKEMLEAVLSEVRIDPGLMAENVNVRPKAPGMRYRHYAPKAALTIIEGEREAVICRICELAMNAGREAGAGCRTGEGTGFRVGLLVSAETEEIYRRKLQALRKEAAARPDNSGDSGVSRGEAERFVIRAAGHMSSEDEIAHNLFAILREFDAAGVDVIYSEAFDSPNLGAAIMNRLLKAAGHHIEQAN